MKFPIRVSYAANTTFPAAGVLTFFPGGDPTSTPEWKAFFPVKGEMRGPNLDVIGPLIGQIEGVPAQRSTRSPATVANLSSILCSLEAWYSSQTSPASMLATRLA